MTYQINLNFDDYGPNGLRLYSYPKILSILAHQHLKNTDQGVGVILQNRYAWAIISMKISISKKIEDDLSIFGNTWFSGQKGPYYRREFEVFSNDTVIKGASYSVLLDLENRKVYRGKDLPFKRLEEIPNHLVDLRATYRENHEYIKLSKRTVPHSHIDALGHVNHLKYIEYIYDALTPDLVKKAYNFNSMELFFQKEMMVNNNFSVNVYEDKDKLVFMLYNESNQEESFILLLENE